MPKTSSFEEWKRKKMEAGDWLTHEEFKRKKDLERKEYLERELEIINKRLNPKMHSQLEQEFLIYYNDETTSKKENSKKRKLEEKKEIKREVILDTETTGLSSSDAIVELSMLELVDGIKTGRHFHKFLNPRIAISKKAVEIHKITNEKLKDCQIFPQIAKDVIKFIGNATIIAHNANFDKKMLNNELLRAGWEPYPDNRFIDTLEICRFLYPKEKNSQDALCQRFEIDNHNRMSTGIHSAAEDTAHLYLIYKQLEKKLDEKDLTPYDFRLNCSIKVG